MARLSASSQGQVQVDDGYLIALAKTGDPTAYDRLVRRYYGFVRLKASSYFLIGGDSDDLIQEDEESAAGRRLVVAGMALIALCIGWLIADQVAPGLSVFMCLGLLLFSSMVVIVMNLVTDLCYRLIDPRIKTG